MALLMPEPKAGPFAHGVPAVATAGAAPEDRAGMPGAGLRVRKGASIPQALLDILKGTQ